MIASGACLPVIYPTRCLLVYSTKADVYFVSEEETGAGIMNNPLPKTLTDGGVTIAYITLKPPVSTTGPYLYALRLSTCFFRVKIMQKYALHIE